MLKATCFSIIRALVKPYRVSPGKYFMFILNIDVIFDNAVNCNATPNLYIKSQGLFCVLRVILYLTLLITTLYCSTDHCHFQTHFVATKNLTRWILDREKDKEIVCYKGVNSGYCYVYGTFTTCDVQGLVGKLHNEYSKYHMSSVL